VLGAKTQPTDVCETFIEKMLSYTLQFGTRGYRYRVVMETFYATGIRRTELLYLDIDDVKLSEVYNRSHPSALSAERLY